MKNKFPGYYLPSKEEFSVLWSKGLFIFDTSVLLDFYRYTPETVDTLFAIMEKVNERIWIPYHVAYEYHKNFCNVIAKQANEYTVTIEIIKELRRKFETQRSHPFLSTKLSNKTTKLLIELTTELEEKEKEITALLNENNNKEKLAAVFDNKIGKGFTMEQLEDVYKEGENRYLKEVPPGYMDGKKKPIPDKYGDLVIWKEILEKAKTIDDGIIFITSDEKEDWFSYERGRTIGPRPELISEYKTIKNTNFYCYNTASFLKYAQEFLDVKVNEETIKEINELKLPSFENLSQTSESSGDIIFNSNMDTNPYNFQNIKFRNFLQKWNLALDDNSKTENPESENKNDSEESDLDSKS